MELKRARVDAKGAVIICLTAAVLVLATIIIDLYRRDRAPCFCDVYIESACTWDISAEQAEVQKTVYELTVPGESLDDLADEVGEVADELRKLNK